jgi:16S rRNA G966 N2-methylase RsmD
MFADAPYGSGDALTAAVRLANIGALAADALVILETEESEQPDPELAASGGLSPLDNRRYGRAMLHFLKVVGG